MRKILLIFFFITVCTVMFFAGDLIVNINDGRLSLPDVTVAIPELKLSLISDDRGQVIFKNLPDGKYTIFAVLAGYEKYNKPIEVSGSNQNVSIRINKVTFNMGEITVKSKRNKGKVTTQTTVKQEELQANTQSFVNDAIKTLQTMPGVSGSGGSFDSKMYIQGGNSYEWIASMDGVFIMNPSRWGGNISMFNPLIIDDIDLYTAGYPAMYGQGLSGIIVVETKNGNKEKWKGFFDMSTATAEIMLEGPVSSNVTVLFNARRTFYDFIMPLFIPEDQRAGTVYPYLWDGILKLSWDITPQDSLSIEGYGSLEGMKWTMSGDPNGGENSGNLKGRFIYEDIYIMGNVKYNHRFESEDAFDIIFGYDPHFGHYQFQDSAIIEQDIQVREYFYQLGANYYLNSIKGHKFQTGGIVFYADPWSNMKYKHYSLNLLGEWTNDMNLDQEYNSSKIAYGGIYGEDNWEIIPSLILELGAREEYYTLNKEYAFNPQAGFKWEITKEWDFYTRGGLYHLYPFSIQDVDSNLGNPNLQSEKAYHLITGIDYSDSLYSFKFEGFYKRYFDLRENDTKIHINNNGVKDVYGGDIYLQKKAIKGDWFSGWISYTYVYGVEKITSRSDPLPTEGYNTPLDKWFVPGYLRSHTLSSVIEMTYYKNPDKPSFIDFLNEWKLSFDLRVLSGKPYTPITNFIAYSTPAGTQYLFQNGEYNSELTPWNVKLDIKITVPGSIFELLKLFGMDIKSYSYISLVNVFNYKNVTDYVYTVKDGQLNKVEVKDFPFMVLGGMRVEF